MTSDEISYCTVYCMVYGTVLQILMTIADNPETKAIQLSSRQDLASFAYIVTSAIVNYMGPKLNMNCIVDHQLDEFLPFIHDKIQL
jgi:hypothetical protein